MRVQPQRPLLILLAFLLMLPTIGFDDDHLFIANEVSYKPADLFLSAKFQPLHLLRAQMPPQQPFGISGLLSQFLGGLR